MAWSESARPRASRVGRDPRQVSQSVRSSATTRPSGAPNPSSDSGARMPKPAARRIYALDTNVLLHDPTALFRFEEHDVFIPMTVLEELDEKKQGVSEVARNARQASRFLNELIERNSRHGIADGVPLAQPDGVKLRSGGANGRLYFQTQTGNGQGKADNRILAAILDLREHNPDARSEERRVGKECRPGWWSRARTKARSPWRRRPPGR